MTRCLSELALDRLVVDDLDGETTTQAREHLSDCQRCAGRLAAIEADRSSFRAAPPPMRRRTWRPAIAVAAAAAAAALLLFVALPPPEGTRTKGGARLGFHVRHAGEVRLGGPGERVEPGDALAFHFALVEPAWVAVVSVDGAGRTSVYVPVQRLEAGQERRIEQSTILDGILGEETLTGWICPGPFDPSAPPAECARETIRIRKEPGR